MFLAALAASALLSVAVAVAADRATSAQERTPELRTVKRQAFSQITGVQLSPARQPWYCGAEQAVADRGWFPGWTGGCALGLAEARKGARMAEPFDLLEAVLASVDSSRSPNVARNSLVWVLVLHPRVASQPVIACGPAPSGPANPCPAQPPATPLTIVVIVDARSARTLLVANVSGGVPPLPAPARVAPGQPGPVPTPVRPPPAPVAVPSPRSPRDG